MKSPIVESPIPNLKVSKIALCVPYQIAHKPIHEPLPKVKLFLNDLNTKKTIRAYAECGVDFISVGALTHSASSLDLSLKAI